MKNDIFQKTVIVAFFMSICFMTNYVTANDNSQETNDNYLTIRESLIPMFMVTGLVSNEEFPFNRINPDIREYILFYLDKDNYSYSLAANGIRLLGFVGRNEDIEFVDAYLESRLKNTENDENFRRASPNVALSSGAFTGIMIKRDIKGAKQFFQKYGQISTWMPLESASPQHLELAKRCYSAFIIGAYQYSKLDFMLTLLKQKASDLAPFIHESLVDSLEKMKIDLYTECMKPYPVSERKLEDKIDKYLEKYGQSIDLLLKKQTLAQWRETQEKQKAVPREEKKVADSHEKIDLSETVESGFLKAVASEAVKSYERISVELFDRDINDLPIKKEILQEIQKAGLNNYDGFQIMVEVEAKIDGFIPEFKNNQASAAVVKENETASVTFNIKGSADIVRKYIPDIGSNSLISPTTGDVTINMKRVNNKWCWSPASDSNVDALANIVEDNYLVESVGDAMVAYKQISKTLTDGSYNLLTIPVLEDGKIIPLNKREKLYDEMIEDLGIEIRVLEDLEKAGLNNYTDYRIKVMYEAVLNNGGVNIKGYETADVTFMIIDGTKIFKKHAPRETDYDGPEGSKNLQVYMKRINSKWYWNPFGCY